MKKIRFEQVNGSSASYFGLLGIIGLFILGGAFAFFTLEHHGHYISGMDNQIVWGTPHVFAVFLIVAASGALNVASIGTVFDKEIYKPLGPLSAILSICLLVGGLAILVLDLGHPDRLIVAMTYYNFKSIFAWNMILYNGFFVFVGVYLWTMLDHNVYKFKSVAGFFAFIWRLALTTGTGSIFGFLVARDAYDTAIMAPMFVIMSFSFGLAIFMLVLFASYNWTGRPLGDRIVTQLKNLLGVFAAAVLYFVLVFHLTNLYSEQHGSVERFLLLGENGGSLYAKLFWIVQVLIGGLIPIFMLFHPALGKCRKAITMASVLIIVGGLAQLYIIIIGGQAFPLILFPEMEVISSGFQDGISNPYTPSIYEVLLGLGGVGVAMFAVTFAVKILRLLPASLADEYLEDHVTKSAT